MKKIVIILFFLIASQTMIFAVQSGAAIDIKARKSSLEQRMSRERPKVEDVVQSIQKGDKWGAFWINFVVAAVGVYSIYGFGAGIISAGLTYFITNGDKKAFHMAMWGSLAGMIVGGGLRLLYLYSM